MGGVWADSVKDYAFFVLLILFCVYKISLREGREGVAHGRNSIYLLNALQKNKENAYLYYFHCRYQCW